MKIIDIQPSDADRLVPLLQELNAIHAAHQPARHTANSNDKDLSNWIADWITLPEVHALGAESPQGALLGYLIYAIEDRPALPVRAAEQRAMLHHIAVEESWRRMGIGKALISELKARVMAQRISTIAATYAPFNTASAGLMHGMGLAPVLTVAEWRA